jgi:hypothetical protein
VQPSSTPYKTSLPPIKPKLTLAVSSSENLGYKLKDTLQVMVLKQQLKSQDEQIKSLEAQLEEATK